MLPLIYSFRVSISSPDNTVFTVNKQKWVPLDIDLTQNRGTTRSPRYNHRERNGEGKIIYV